MNYEGQICRAPMERSSYMLPIMVGCSYNSCRFCNLFRHLKFRALPMEEIEAECARVEAVGGSPKRIFLGDGNAFVFSAEYLLEIIESALAEFLNRTKPAHIVNFSLFLHEEVPLYEEVKRGAFRQADELETLREERYLTELLAAKGDCEFQYDGLPRPKAGGRTERICYRKHDR